MPVDFAFWRNLSADAVRRIEAVRAEEERRLPWLRFKQPLDFMCEYEPFHSLHDGLPVFESDTELDEFCFHNYILIVFLAFVKEACTMGRLGKWDIARVRSESMAFLRDFAQEAYDSYDFDRRGSRLQPLSSEAGDLLPEVAFRYRLSQGWRDFEGAMLDLCDNFDSEFWRDLEVKFRELLQIPESSRLTELDAGGKWSVQDGASDERERARLLQLFRLQAQAGAFAAGVPNGTDALDGWLDLLRKESPHFNEESGHVQNLVLASAEYCIVRAARAFESETAATVAGVPALSATEPRPDESGGADAGPPKTYKTDFGRNVDRLRKECGWSFDELAEKTELDKKLILGHVNDGKGAYPRTVKRYAAAFTKKLNRTITVAELES